MKAPTRMTVQKFIRQSTEESSSDYLLPAELFAKWQEWCEQERCFSANVAWFGRTLTEIGLPRMRVTGSQAVVGIKWRETPSSVKFGEELSALSGPAWRQLAILFTDNGYDGATAKLSLG